MGTRKCKKINSFVPIPVSHPANTPEGFGRHDWPRISLNRSEKVLRFHGNDACPVGDWIDRNHGIKNVVPMKTANASDLTTRLPTILAWLEAGEEVMVKPDAKRSSSPSVIGSTVDWNKSAAFQREVTGEPVLSKKDLEDLYEEMGSRF